MNLTSCPRSSSNFSLTKDGFVGWVPESPGRGTLSLIVSCLTTIFLCTWVVIHARVSKRPFLHRLHKFALFLKAIIAPEFIAVEALQEWFQAHRTVKNCARSTGEGLKLIHAFYIGMLALKYRKPRGDKVLWPNQYVWLLEQGLIDWEDHKLWGLSEENICDKSNADGIAKLLALIQVTWFVTQSILRHVHNLPLAQLESMTLSYIPLVAITYFFWWIKPKDVMTPAIVNLPDMFLQQETTFESMAVSNTFDNEDLGRQNSLWTIWYLTSRVFEKEAKDKLFQAAKEISNSREIKQADGREDPRTKNSKDAEGQRSTCLSGGPTASASEVVVAYWDPEMYHFKILWPIICLFGASFGALHLLSWNTPFPTLVEQWLWRVAALVSIFSMLIFMQFEKVVLRWEGPLTIISLVSPALYLLSRIVMIGGVIAAFRASDPAVYDTYVVSTYWIHFL
ncbi:MAG: hypothetical protein Q9167_004211 [Letrouitia subvulpina]